jgi:hypothetical protein
MKLNEDMEEALQNVEVNDITRAILHDILYLERLNKEKEWALDAKKTIKQIIDDKENAS